MIKTDITVGIKYTSDDVKRAICEHLPIEACELGKIKILKKALKLDGEGARYALSVGIELSPEREAGLLKMKKKVALPTDVELKLYADREKWQGRPSPVIVGAGPAGLFAALIFALHGAEPIIIERGLPVEERAEKVRRFFGVRELDTECNIQFGEGGAGAFSDGKLKVGSMDAFKHFVLSSFVDAGADEDITYTVGAHLGTDKLPSIVASIRERLKSLGARFIYSARLCDIRVKDGKLTSVVYEKGGAKEAVETDICVLATGHSAEDVFVMLYEKGIPMEQKGFGIGMRIEHPRELVNSMVYKDATIADDIGTASYHLVTHLASGRSVYSFCMCPGGTVVAAASANGGVVTNGMSEYARMADNSNSALLVSVTPSDFGSDSVLSGIEFQRRLESAAYIAGGASFAAPCVRLDDFLKKEARNAFSSVKPSYPCGVLRCSPDEYLPSYITDSLRLGIEDFDKWMPGFNYGGAVLTGAETRSTSPIRILRNERYSSPVADGLYPIGEGAGYAGGIVSSATDGARVAYSICSRIVSDI